MTWIRTVPYAESDGELANIYRQLYTMYPPEYAVEVDAVKRPDGTADSIMSAHSLMPKVLWHIFAAFAEMMRPELPLSRRQHEMIATLVSALNRCFY